MIEPLRFPVVSAPEHPVWWGFREFELTLVEGCTASVQPRDRRSSVAQMDRKTTTSVDLGRDIAAELAAAREQGVREGRQAEQEAHKANLEAMERRHMEQCARIAEGLAIERDRYVRTVEQEVVELALAIAARVLRREAQIDPLLLTGAVRAALGQLSEGTTVRLRVPASEAGLWTETMVRLPNMRVRPVVISDSDLQTGECIIESDSGSADLRVRSQVAEIGRMLLEDHRSGPEGAACL